jgi:predicted TIM-barrel fold metal-dependent hydrolase
MELPLKESVKKKWMGENAARIFEGMPHRL